jgi:3-dehydroquinate synthase
MKTIFLYGPPGAGKSSVGRALAQALEMAFVDLDVEIEQSSGSSIPQIMAEWGEPGFRDIESAALRRVLKNPGQVIALGGGALLREQNRALAESRGRVVVLMAELETLLRRLEQDANQRPLLAGDRRARLSALLDQRREHYHSFGLRAVTDGLTCEEISWSLQIGLGAFRVKGMGQPYDVLVEPGRLDALGSLLRENQLNGPLAVVSDENVAPLYAGPLLASLQEAGFAAALVTIPAGENSKTIETVSELWRNFLQLGLDRKSTVLALGGGVVGDLTGFAAATFMRGVPWVGLPTSLLAMVDSSLGGKTGFDLPEGKNLVGAFFPPRLVVAAPELLGTLSLFELRSGLAEVVKHGIIADPLLFGLCSSGLPAVQTNLVEIVQRAMAVKIKVIEADPYERGLRAALNFGHTVGHALEKVTNYSLRHGEAVAIGMVVEARLAEKLWICSKGFSNQLAAVLSNLALPVAIPPGLPRADLVAAMRNDKKRAAGVVHFALPEEVGTMQVGVKVENLDMVLGDY